MIINEVETLTMIAEALGVPRPKNGEPLTIGWTWVIVSIKSLRADRDYLQKVVDDLNLEIGCAE